MSADPALFTTTLDRTQAESAVPRLLDAQRPFQMIPLPDGSVRLHLRVGSRPDSLSPDSLPPTLLPLPSPPAAGPGPAGDQDQEPGQTQAHVHVQVHQGIAEVTSSSPNVYVTITDLD